MVKEWVMDQDDFDRFLAWLHPDREEAGKKYEEICRRLMKICRARGFVETAAEEITDETINRVIRKVPEIADHYIGDPALYCYGVLRNVMKERDRRPRPPGSLTVPAPDSWDEKEPRYACLDRCMDEQSPEDRRLLLEYYGAEGREKIDQRRQMAEQLGMSDNALRIRLCRLRAALKACVNQCLEQPAG